VSREFSRALVIMDSMHHLGPEIPSAQVAPIEALVEPIHRDEHRSETVLGNQPARGILNRRDHPFPW